MTDAHAKAVEAAAKAVFVSIQGGELKTSANIITAYLAAMRAEGWVMVRDVGEVPRDDWGDDCWDARADGWNACRAAMLKGAGDEQG